MFTTASTSLKTALRPIAVSCLALSALSACVTTQHADTGAAADAPEASFSLSNSVKYQRQSKEYPVLSAYVYKQATAALPATFENQQTPAVIVLDVDETVLDNSLYQEERESKGLGYSSESWNAWIEREEAALVPGVDKFLATVIERGGKIALITNRDKTLDSHTWNNLLAVGLPLTPSNTCIMGRLPADKDAIDHKYIVNDKDRRRNAVKQGSPACSITNDTASEGWNKPHNIIMQIGDNIEDFQGVTQEDAYLPALLPEVGTSLFILPNPMYGSW